MATRTKKRTTRKKKAAPRKAPTSLAYDSAESDTKRRTPSTRLKSVDHILTPTKRKRLVSSTRDIVQNFSIAQWAVKRHLDYNSSFSFQPRTGDDELDRQLHDLMHWYERPLNCDVSGRHSFCQLIRMCEERRVVDGDVFLVKMSSGHLQAIESDRVRTDAMGNSSSDDGLIHGCRVSKGGRLQSIAIHNRTASGGYEFARTVRAGNVYQLGYFDRFDQIRGVSPLASSINAFRDVYEGADYALAKMKVSQLFGLAFYRENPDEFGVTAGSDDAGYDVDFGRGPVMLDLSPGDRAEFLESKSPHQEFQSFMETMIGVALKSLGIPFSFYAENFTNFFGAKSAAIHYEKSCKSRRATLRELLDRITLWRLGLFIQDGDLVLPAGMQLSGVEWEWVHDGTPWWDPSKEVRGDVLAIASGLKTRSQVIKERHGRDFRDVVDQLAREEQYIKDAGITVETDKIIISGDTDDEEEDQEEQTPGRP